MQLVNDVKGEPLPQLTCKVCGSALYATDWGNGEITYHCSSPEARFWDFDRGTFDQAKAKQHWDESRLEIFLNKSLDEELDATG